LWDRRGVYCRRKVKLKTGEDAQKNLKTKKERRHPTLELGKRGRDPAIGGVMVFSILEEGGQRTVQDHPSCSQGTCKVWGLKKTILQGERAKKKGRGNPLTSVTGAGETVMLAPRES